ncbi:neprilysin [Dermacentor silvarum]|uniref:neprilysin n=1 Tax=Dermacentor silvarum TaxID=543639 RepID=UPI00189856B8|nr:neprilysin [Dermacentor silvarum]
MSPRCPTEPGKVSSSGKFSYLSPRALYARLITSPPKQKRSALRVTTVLAAVAATLLGVCVLVLFVLFSRWSPQKLALCTTTACSEFAKLIAYSVNQSVDPCSDFDAYVCSGWRFQQKHSVYKAVAINAVDAMTKVIRKGRSPAHPDQSMAQKISLFYRSCDDVWRGERDELPVVREHLLRAGVVWPRISAAPDVLRTLLV